MAPEFLTRFNTKFRSRILKPTSSQKRTLVALAANVVAIIILYNVTFLTPVLYPFKILTVAFHESCHALMTWLTGGSVAYITLDPNEGGVTASVGGATCLILPAGYIGSSSIGALLLFTTFNFQATTIAAVSIGILMLITLALAQNVFAIITTVLVVLTIAATFHPYLKKVRLPNRPHLGPILRYFIVMFTGTMSAMYSLNDIVSDVVVRQVEGSDAAMFSQHCIYLPAVIHGILWVMLSFCFVATGVILGMLVWKSDDEDEEVAASKFGSYFTLA